MVQVTVVGGSGDVGSLILPALASRYDVVNADLRPSSALPLGCGQFHLTDVTDPDSVRQACEGSKALVYLAMGPKVGWGSDAWAQRQFDINVTGLYVTLQAAAHAGLQRFVHASTGSIYDDYRQRPLPPHGDATDAYGLSKALAEQVCAAVVREHGMSGLSLRLFNPMADEKWNALGALDAAVSTAGSDVASAIQAALEADLNGYCATSVTSDATDLVIDCGPTRQLLGWTPLSGSSNRKDS